MTVFLYVLVGMIAYIGIGVWWSFMRWISFVNGEISFYEAERRGFIRFHRIQGPEIPDFLKYEWRKHIEVRPRLQRIPPDPQEHHPQLVLNLVLWPLSVGSLIAQTLYRLTVKRLIVEYTSSLDTRIKEVRKDFDK